MRNLYKIKFRLYLENYFFNKNNYVNTTVIVGL
jgi:hypothetical protein